MRSALVLFVLLATATAARADVHEVKAGKVSVDLPKKWAVDTKDDVIRAVSPDNQVAWVLVVVDTPEVKAALTRLEGELYSAVQGLRWIDSTKKKKIHTLPSTIVQGVGVSARATQLDVLVVVSGPTPAKKGIIMFAAVEHDKLAANNKTIMAAFNSLKPTK
ncbi:MAG: hypothetical protein HOV81_13690 [Kofleriaceae bacterium]|nr:hypothetical protein [Kofleriaceae bacterium]